MLQPERLFPGPVPNRAGNFPGQFLTGPVISQTKLPELLIPPDLASTSTIGLPRTNT